jgi:2-methylcitrate dehydratase PrpD
MTTVLEHFGTWIASMKLEDAPDEAREVARRAIIDYVGVTFAAREGDVAEVLEAYLAGHGPGPAAGSTVVIGQGASAPAELAAFANGALGHALDFDDCNQSMGGHPTIAIFPAALAAAQTVGADGARLLEAYIVGFEVMAKLGRGVNFAHYERGWHPTATLGAFGATAAAAKILGLDAERTTAALAIAASFASGLKGNFGTMTKPLQAGRAAQNGVAAARLAQVCATANPAVLETAQGWGEVYQGIETVDLDVLRSPFGAPWELVETAVIVKRFPCCASTHGAIEAALDARTRLDPDAAIEDIRIWTHPRRLKHTNRAEVSTGFQGKFSVQYCVAVALHQGSVGIADFTPEAIARPEVRSLMDRLLAEPMPEERWGSDHFPAEVAVRTVGASEPILSRIERPKGNGKELALTDVEIAEKFHDCTRAGGRSEATSEELLDLLRHLDGLADLDELLRLLA